MIETRHAIDPVSGERVEIRNDLTKRLRGQYAMGPTLANGEPEFGWRSFGDPVPIQIEAAEEIERLQSQLAHDLTKHQFELMDLRARAAKTAERQFEVMAKAAQNHRTDGNEESMDRCNARARSAAYIAADIRTLPLTKKAVP